MRALEAVWGTERVRGWLAESSQGERIQSILGEDLGPAGFPSLQRRLMNHMKPETALQFLQELGDRLVQPARLTVGRSMALIIGRFLSRRTEDIDVVDEIPAPIRSEHRLLNELAERYDLRLAHFQSHYLPEGWERRVRSLGRFGKLDIHLVDEYDIAAGKLCSGREKDRDDVRALARKLDKGVLADRLKRSGGKLLTEGDGRRNAERNWHIVYGEALPS